MLSINTNLSSLTVQKNLSKSTINLNQAIERLTTGYKINHAADNAANYSISRNYDTKLSSYGVAQDNVAMASSMMATASDTLDNMTSNAMRLRELCVQAQNGTYGKQSIAAIKSEAGAIVSQIANLYRTAEYNGIQLFDIYSDRLVELQANSDTPSTPIGLTSDISPKYDGFISDPYYKVGNVRMSDEEINATYTHVSAIDETEGLTESIYAVSTAEDLAKLAALVNAGEDTSGKTFVMGADIDLFKYCREHIDSDGNGGWTAIGNNSNQFKGTFDGNGHTVSGLYINKATSDYQGLFGCISVTSKIKNVGIERGNVKGKNSVGILTGQASGSISNCYANGNISGTSYIGGLAGTAANVIENSYATGNVTGTGNNVGGLVGNTGNTVRNSYATCTVTGVNNVGGLVGNAWRSITNSYATGSVSGKNSVGGLAGYAHNPITNSYTTDSVSGTTSVGGFVGYTSDTISKSYATGDVNGTYRVGGFAGFAEGSISNSYATGNISSTGNLNGSSFTGGFIGKILKTTGSAVYKNNASFGTVTASVETGSGSLIGGIANTEDGANFGTVTITNCITNSNDGNDAIGGAYKYADSIYTAIDEPENMAEWNSNITTFDTKTQLQVGIYGDSSSRITTQTNIDFGLMKQLESLDVSKVSSIEFIDSFLEKLNNKSTELGAVTDRLMSAADSISTAIDNLTSSRSTIKDADISKESSNYIKSQILQQASATLLSTANQTPALTLQLLQGLK